MVALAVVVVVAVVVPKTLRRGVGEMLIRFYGKAT